MPAAILRESQRLNLAQRAIISALELGGGVAICLVNKVCDAIERGIISTGSIAIKACMAIEEELERNQKQQKSESKQCREEAKSAAETPAEISPTLRPLDSTDVVAIEKEAGAAAAEAPTLHKLTHTTDASGFLLGEAACCLEDLFLDSPVQSEAKGPQLVAEDLEDTAASKGLPGVPASISFIDTQNVGSAKSEKPHAKTSSAAVEQAKGCKAWTNTVEVLLAGRARLAERLAKYEPKGKRLSE